MRTGDANYSLQSRCRADQAPRLSLTTFSRRFVLPQPLERLLDLCPVRPAAIFHLRHQLGLHEQHAFFGTRSANGLAFADLAFSSRVTDTNRGAGRQLVAADGL